MEQAIIKYAIMLGIPGLALAVFYLLLRKLSFKFQQIKGGWAAIVAIIFIFVVGGITTYALTIFKEAPSGFNKLNHDMLPDLSAPLAHENIDGSWEATILPTEQGTILKSSNGSALKFEKGEKVEISSSGYVDIGRGLVSPDGELNYSDVTMDGPYKNHVGGLEMWIGPNKNGNRYFLGTFFSEKIKDSGVPTLRVIESIHGYNDRNNSGEFRVVVRKVKSE